MRGMETLGEILVLNTCAVGSVGYNRIYVHWDTQGFKLAYNKGLWDFQPTASQVFASLNDMIDVDLFEFTGLEGFRGQSLDSLTWEPCPGTWWMKKED